VLTVLIAPVLRITKEPMATDIGDRHPFGVNQVVTANADGDQIGVIVGATMGAVADMVER
jgi:hypothetical protein